MDRDEVEVHKLAKTERGQYPAILTEQTWSVKDLLYGFRGNFACGIQRVAPSVQDGSILPARVANHSAIWVILPARGASHIINFLMNFLSFLSSSWPSDANIVFPWKLTETPDWEDQTNFTFSRLKRASETVLSLDF